jgi:serine/threonine protein phosphatase PrpC
VSLVLRHAALSDIGLHRDTNEDAFVAAPPLFAVADGMGGAQAGEVASRTAVDTVRDVVATGRPLIAAATEANTRIFALAATDEQRAGMGTTLTAVHVHGDGGEFVHIGDSRAYLFRDGELRQLSDDHSLVGEWVRDGQLTVEEAAAHRLRSILSRALGTEPEAEIDHFEVEFRPGDVLLLCSDGLSGPVGAGRIAALLVGDDPEESARRLVDEAKKRGGHDNITVVVVRLVADEDDDKEATASDATEAHSGVAVDGVADAEKGGEEVGRGEGGEGPPAEPAAVTPPVVAPPEPPAGRRSHRRIILLVVLILIALVLVAAVLATTNLYYVGVDGSEVSVMRGLPGSVAGLSLHTVYLRSTLPYASLSADNQRMVEHHHLGGETAAIKLLRRLEAAP